MNAIKPVSDHDPKKKNVFFSLGLSFLISKVHGIGCDDLPVLTCSIQLAKYLFSIYACVWH